VVEDLVDNQGWRYDLGRNRGGHPVLYPREKAQPTLSVPTTPGDNRSFANWISQVRRRGGIWPRRTQ
jgi:hypothetical protein